MDHLDLLCTFVATIIVCVAAKSPSPCTQLPLHVWPLGPGMVDLDIVGNTRGTVGDVTSGSFQPAVGYESTRFSGNQYSFISVTVDSYTPIDDFDDYAFQFYVKFDDVTQGTILSFESHSYDGNPLTTEIRKYQLEILNGDIRIIVTDFGEATITTGLVAGIWYHIVLMRDKNQEFFSIFLNHGNNNENGQIHKNLADAPTIFPASVVIGRNGTADPNPLLGELACLQFVPCKSPFESTYDIYCLPTAWPNITTNPSSTSTNVPTASSSTTTTTASATTTTTRTTTTTASPPTTTTTTTTTTTIIPTTLSMSSGTTATTSIMENTALYSTIVETCMQYEMAANVTFGNPADVLETVNVSTIKNCVQHCNSSPLCTAFTFDGTMCSLGVYKTTEFSAGSKLYIRTP